MKQLSGTLSQQVIAFQMTSKFLAYLGLKELDWIV